MSAGSTRILQVLILIAIIAAVSRNKFTSIFPEQFFRGERPHTHTGSKSCGAQQFGIETHSISTRRWCIYKINSREFMCHDWIKIYDTILTERVSARGLKLNSARSGAHTLYWRSQSFFVIVPLECRWQKRILALATPLADQKFMGRSGTFRHVWLVTIELFQGGTSTDLNDLPRSYSLTNWGMRAFYIYNSKLWWKFSQ